MQTGYPRFFIHSLIETLARHICHKAQHDSSLIQKAMLFPGKIHALQCERYLTHHATNNCAIGVSIRTVSLALRTPGAALQTPGVQWEQAEFHAVLYPSHLYPLAKSFWQHTGFGISSRYAEFCLGRIDDLQIQTFPTQFKPGWEDSAEVSEKERACISARAIEDEEIKGTLRRRIAKLASGDKNTVEEKDVYLFPSGMSAISTIAQALHTIKNSDASLKVVAHG